MPSPLSTPTNELLPNQLPMAMTALEWSNDNSNPIKDMQAQPDSSHQRFSAKRDISESQTSSTRRTGRLGLNLDLNQHSSDNNARKKPLICFGKDLNEELSPQVIDVSIPLEKQRCVRGFMHIKMVQQSDGSFTFGTSHLSFASIPQIVSHFGSNRLAIRGAEHMSLLYPIVVQLL